MCLQNSCFFATIVIGYYADFEPKTGHYVCAPKIHYLAIKFMSYSRRLYEYPHSLHLTLHIGTLLNIIAQTIIYSYFLFATTILEILGLVI